MRHTRPLKAGNCRHAFLVWSRVVPDQAGTIEPLQNRGSTGSCRNSPTASRRGLAASLPAGDPRPPVLLSAPDEHARAALGHVTGSHYAVEHWLAAYAVLPCAGAADGS